MPVFVAWLLAGIGSALASWATSLLVAFGLSVVTYTVAVPALKGFLISQFAGVPSAWVELIGYMQVDKAMTMILSAAVVGGISRVTVGRRAPSGP